jgi:hypothetical protein
VFVIDDIINAIMAGVASNQQQDSIGKAMDTQRDLWNPYLDAGKTSLADLMRLQSDPSAIQNSPAYQFRMGEGQKALERSAAARGGLGGGGFAKGLARYSQGLASDEYGNQWNRLYQMSGRGQDAANVYGSNMANLQVGQGNAQAAGTIGIGKGVAGGIASAGNLLTLGMGGGLGSGIQGLLGGGGGGGGGINPGASSVPQSTGYVSNLIPQQQRYGFGYGQG